MIGTIIGAIVVGLIVGALARLIMPGKQNIGVIMTIVLGALGSFIGTWLDLPASVTPTRTADSQVIPFLVGRRRRDHPDRALRRHHRRAARERRGALARCQPVDGAGVVVGDVDRAVRSDSPPRPGGPTASRRRPGSRRRGSADCRDCRSAKGRTPPRARAGAGGSTSRARRPARRWRTARAARSCVKLMPSGAACAPRLCSTGGSAAQSSLLPSALVCTSRMNGRLAGPPSGLQ